MTNIVPTDPDDEEFEIEDPPEDKYKPRKFDYEQQRIFLEEFAKTGVMKKALDCVNVTYRTVKRAREQSERFRKAFEEAKEMAVHQLEDAAYTRAVEGEERPVYQDGELVGYEEYYSDNLLWKLLKHWNPDRYDPNQQSEVSGNVNITINAPSSDEDEEKEVIEAEVNENDGE